MSASVIRIIEIGIFRQNSVNTKLHENSLISSQTVLCVQTEGRSNFNRLPHGYEYAEKGNTKYFNVMTTNRRLKT